MVEAQTMRTYRWSPTLFGAWPIGAGLLSVFANEDFRITAGVWRELTP
jgi:hypothetical protein